MKKQVILLILGLFFFCTGDLGAASKDFPTLLKQVRKEALSKGISKKTVNLGLKNVRLLKKTVKSEKNQKEFKLTFRRYLGNYLTPTRIANAKKNFKKHSTLLQAIRREYHVQPQFIVSLWGVESNFGSYMGNFPVFSTLATLAQTSHRGFLFRKELINALRMLEEKTVTFSQMKGSWAGAMGQVQFLPSRYLRYAVDYNRDGKKDIWSHHGDIFASTGNFLRRSGWSGSKPMTHEVRLPKNFSYKLVGLRTKKKLKEWRKMGLRYSNGKKLDARNLPTSILMPDGKKGQAYLIYPNFYVIRSWNNSNWFALSVSILANKIAR